MSYLNHANELLSDLLQYAQHIETITGEPTEADFTALTRASECCADLVDAVAAYQSEALYQKRALMETYPEHHFQWLRARAEG